MPIRLHASGTVWPWEQYGAVAGATRTAGLSVFTDGARLLNAAAASGISADRWGAEVDAVWIDFSKGLGAPGGAAIAGSEEFITAANRFKYMLGGAMRQSGILAAACLHGLTHNVAGLADDHARARRLAAGLDGTGMAVESPQSNMVFFDPAPLGISPGDLVGRLATAGIRVSPVAGRIRAVTHLGVGDDDIDDAIAAIREQAGG